MASPLHCLLLLLSAICILTAPTSATSRKSLNHDHKKDQISLRIPLTRIDSGKNFTKAEHIKRAVERGMRKFQRHTTLATGASYDAQTPLRSGGGEFLMDITFGTPPMTYQEVMDTGSDLIWTQCQPCQKCYNQPFQIFDPDSSSTFSVVSCSSQYCQDLPSSTCDYNSNGCDYQYGYGDSSSIHSSSIQGYLGSDTITLDSASFPNIVFGCSNNNHGTFEQTGAAGIVGTGNSPLSLPTQLQVSEFTYCLTSVDSSATSTYYLGPAADAPSGTKMTTPLALSSQEVYYFINCVGMSVGGQEVGSADDFAPNGDGNGGMIIDSGTTFTNIPSNVMQNLQNVIPQITGLSMADSDYGLPLCLQLNDYDYGSNSNTNLPDMVIHLQGMDLNLSGENVWTYPTQGIACLAMTALSGLPLSILGNVQQQNYWIRYDLANEVLEFTQTTCGQ
ncbi:hypothetical protein Ancab_000291 [Ancistrocladus abbreviatus]